MKIVSIFIILGILNYSFYPKFFTETINSLSIKRDNQSEIFVYLYYGNEFLTLFIFLVAKFYKLTINITSINMGKIWEHRTIAFTVISLIRYIVKLKNDIYLFYTVIKIGVLPFFLLFDILMGAYHVLKLGWKIYQNVENTKYINNLVDYHQKVEFEKIFREMPMLTEEQKEKIKNEKTLICNICLCEIEEGKYLNCGHVIHLKCIKEWLISNTNCPVCRNPILNERGIRSKFYNNQLGIQNNNNNQEDQNVLDEAILEKINLNEMGSGSYIPKKNIELEKFAYYKKLEYALEKLGKIEDSKKEEIKPGSVSFSLPCEAILDRTVRNEVKRLELELVNKKLLSIYESPLTAMMNHEDLITNTNN